MDNSNQCANNPPNCLLAANITGACIQASPGYYVQGGTVFLCASTIIGCNICEVVGGVPSCTVCYSTGILSSANPKSCDCFGMEWYNSQN